MFQENNNKENEKNQIKILVDINKNGRIIDWKSKKISNLLLAKSYKRLHLKKSYRVQECGTIFRI